MHFHEGLSTVITSVSSSYIIDKILAPGLPASMAAEYYKMAARSRRFRLIIWLSEEIKICRRIFEY